MKWPKLCMSDLPVALVSAQKSLANSAEHVHVHLLLPFPFDILGSYSSLGLGFVIGASPE